MRELALKNGRCAINTHKKASKIAGFFGSGK
jgi:hypothetical protein